ncbi:MAG: hypothetical protein ACOX47_02925 [Bacillota bacterium]|jgi:hypothetical protein
MIQKNCTVNEERTNCPPLITDELIRVFPVGRNYNEYFKNVLSDYRFAKEFFPLLNICMLPTVKPREIYMYGWLLPNILCNTTEKEENIKKYGIYILAYYSSNYPEEDIEVEDICGAINWELIPERYRHRTLINGRPTGLCTHHPDGEINDVPNKHRTVKILMSAWKLYYQYKEYLRTGVWSLPDLPHGDEAYRILKKQGYIDRVGRKLRWKRN